MSYISKIDLSTAPQEVRAAVDNHLAQGYQLTNEKLPLLHNHKYKSLFHLKAKMIAYDEVEGDIGHAPCG